ncbi:MAG: hypothetical protein WC699_14790 [Bacteroidales bacterium]|jgi:hypothetical protein
MKKVISLTLILGLLVLPWNHLCGQDSDSVPQAKHYSPLGLWGLGLKATTDGFGVELVKGFGQRLNIRIGYSTLAIPFSQEIPLDGFSARADAKFKFGGANLLIDFYAVKNVIHITGGVLQNAMKHSVTITPTSDYQFGDILVPAADLGSLEATVTPEYKFSPYVALGFGNTLSRQHRVSFNFELGALYHGAPQVNLSGTNMLGPMASPNNAQVLMTAIGQYKWYPMISMQLSFRII